MNTNNIEGTFRKINQRGIIAIICGSFPADEILKVCSTLLATHLRVIKVTLNSPAVYLKTLRAPLNDIEFAYPLRISKGTYWARIFLERWKQGKNESPAL